MIHNFDQWLNESSQDLKSELQVILDNNSEGLDMDEARDMMNKIMSKHPGKDELIEEFFALMVSLEGEYDEYHNSGESKTTIQQRIDEVEEGINTLLETL